MQKHQYTENEIYAADTLYHCYINGLFKRVLLGGRLALLELNATTRLDAASRVRCYQGGVLVTGGLE
jgi:hypothetical protein